MERKLKQYILVTARGNGKTAYINKMISRLAEGKCVCCGESVSEGHEICTDCEKRLDDICKNGKPCPLTTPELEFTTVDVS